MIACSRAACTGWLICRWVCFMSPPPLRSGFGVHNQTTSGNLPEGHMRSVVDALCPVFSRPCVPWSAAAGPTVDSVVRGQFGRLAAGRCYCRPPMDQGRDADGNEREELREGQRARPAVCWSRTGRRWSMQGRARCPRGTSIGPSGPDRCRGGGLGVRPRPASSRQARPWQRSRQT